MLPGREPCHLCRIWHMLPGLNLYHTDAAQHVESVPYGCCTTCCKIRLGCCCVQIVIRPMFEGLLRRAAVARARRPGGGILIFMHGRSRMTLDPRVPTMPGRSTSGFHRLGRHCLQQARSAVRCLASPMKGELHPTKNRL